MLRMSPPTSETRGSLELTAWTYIYIAVAVDIDVTVGAFRVWGEEGRRDYLPSL